MIKSILLFCLCSTTLFFCNFISAQPNKGCSKFISPLGLSKGANGNKYLLGDNKTYIEYKSPELNITIPNHFPDKNNIPYDKLLRSGLNSMLFEYKNYHGEMTNSAYIIFALGNYNIINEYILKFINEKIFTDQKLMLSIFNWIKPYYTSVFNELTYTEQELLTSKIQLAENYVQIVIKEKNETKFANWLTISGIQEDKKLIGFFKRRIQKEQWTVNDCEVWIKRIKDNIPPLKNKNNLSAHFQITQQINTNIKIACNAAGYYFLIDSSCYKLSFPYSYISCKDSQTVNLYHSLSRLNSSNYDIYKYYINEKGSLIKPWDSTWVDWSNFYHNLIYFEKRNEQGNTKVGLHHEKNQADIINDCEEILKTENEKVIIAIKENVGKLYNNNGELITAERALATNVSSVNDFGEEENRYMVNISFTNNDNWLIFQNEQNKYGVVSISGDVIMPFIFANITLSDSANKLIVLEKEGAAELIYEIVNDKIVGNGRIKGIENYWIEHGKWVEFYENDQTKVEGYYVDGRKNGKWIEYYQNGQIKSKGNYVNGKMQGEWFYYYENGKTYSKVNYVNGKAQGQYLEHYENGQIIVTGNFVEGKEQGEWLEYYKNGKISEKRNYVNGEYQGENLSYYENGKISGKVNYVDGNKQGEAIEYYDNGKVKLKQNYVDGKEQGEAIEYYENGKIKSRSNFIDGKTQGEYLEYYENGQISVNGNYLNGKEQGKWLEYYENGQISAIGNYVNGKMQGEVIGYYRNGQISNKGNGVDDKMQGEWTEFYENGKIKRKSNFIDGNKQGEALTYNENGQMIAKVNYVDGKMQGEAFEYSQNGQISVKVNYVDGKMQGECLNYHLTGQVSVKGNYIDDKKHGEWVYFSEKGQKIATETWNLGESNGDWNNVYVGSVKDIEGNEYPVVNYRGYTYMAENLKVKKMFNGDNIIESKNAKEWKENCAKSLPTYIINKDHPELGPMYNGYAVYDKRGLFPNGYSIIIDSVFYEAYWTLNETNRNCFKNNFLGNTYVSTKAYNTNSQKSKAFYVKPDGKIYECPCKGGRWWMEEINFPHIDMSFSNSCSTGHDGSFLDDYPKPDWQSYGFYVRGFKKD